ncbi:MAG TPA: hypothetical protein VFO55_04345 [Gemmatimonadaceae bacterium]|nr:hypothetical protein [Gemmatimonadaceae bacterium]
MRRIMGCGAALLAAAMAGCGDGTGPGELTSISIRPCAVNAFSPVWFAYRNGDGPWTQVSGDATGTFTFEAEPKASIAYSYPGPESQRVTRIVHATAPELALLAAEPCTASAGSASVSGSATTNGSGAALISMANRSLFMSLPTGQGNFTLTQLPTAATDLVAVGASQSGERWIVRRAIVPNGQTLPVLDFTSAEAQAAQLHSISFSGGPTGGTTNGDARLRTSGGTIHPLSSATGISGPFTVPSLAPAQRHANDVYSVSIQRRNGTGSDFRYIHLGYSDPADRQAVFGPAMAGGTISAVTSAPYPRMRAVFASQAEYPDAARANFLESFRAVRVTTTAAYLGGRPSNWELEMPDLGGAGYQKEWGLFEAPRSWSFEAIKGSLHVLEGGLPRKDETVTIGVHRAFQGGPPASVAPER